MLPGINSAIAGVGGNTNLLGILQSLGLTTNLELCLDAGDALSAPASPTKWLDRSGNGFDFFMGTTSGADATDPTFNGTVGGLSVNEYWSFDGGDFFRYDTGNETWMENLHKDNATATILCWLRLGSLGVLRTIMGTMSNIGTNRGVAFYIDTANKLAFRVGNGSSSPFVDIATTLTAIAADTWYFVGVSFNEAAGSPILFNLNSDTETGLNTVYTAPSAAAASAVCEIGGCGGLDLLPSGSRIGMFAAWEGTALTEANMDAIFQATRGRYGV